MAPDGVRIRLLGTASGVPSRTRYNVSAAVRVGESVYVLDAGEPCAAALVRMGVDTTSVRAVFVSHMHADHSSGLPMLVQWMALEEPRKLRFNVFVPGKSVQALGRYLDATYLSQDFLSFPLKISPLSPGRVYSDEQVKVEAYGNSHLAWLRERMAKNPLINLESYSFRLTAGAKRIVYSGDLGPPDDMDSFIDGTDLLLVELAHFEPEVLFAYLADKRVARVVCLHIHPNWDTRDEECLELAKGYLGDRVAIAHDGMEIEV